VLQYGGEFTQFTKTLIDLDKELSRTLSTYPVPEALHYWKRRLKMYDMGRLYNPTGKYHPLPWMKKEFYITQLLRNDELGKESKGHKELRMQESAEEGNYEQYLLSLDENKLKFLSAQINRLEPSQESGDVDQAGKGYPTSISTDSDSDETRDKIRRTTPKLKKKKHKIKTQRSFALSWKRNKKNLKRWNYTQGDHYQLQR
jgi:hypothetical protein